MKRKRVNFVNSCEKYLNEKGATTAIELIDNVRSSYGKKYRNIPSVMELAMILRIDKRFVIVKKTRDGVSLWDVDRVSGIIKIICSNEGCDEYTSNLFTSVCNVCTEEEE